MMPDKMKAAFDAWLDDKEEDSWRGGSPASPADIVEWTLNYLRSQQEPISDPEARLLALEANADDMTINGELKYCLRLPELKKLIQLCRIPSVPAVPEGMALVPSGIHPLDSAGCEGIVELLRNPPDAGEFPDQLDWYDHWWRCLIAAAPSPTEKKEN